jgi:predicted transcriptional regulator
MNWVFFFSALGILLWFIALLYFKSYIRRHTGAERMLGNLREEIRLLEADIDQKTEQNLELLEERIQTARELIQTMEELRAETEKRITLYARELDRRETQDAAFTALGVTSHPPLSGAPAYPAAPESASPAGKSAPRRKKASAGKARDGRGKKNRLLDTIEVRELNAAQAAGAYKTQSAPPENRPPAIPEPARPESGAPLESSGLPPEAPSAAPPETGGQSARPRFFRSPDPVTPRLPSLRERVAELYRAGFSEDLIAVRLGITITEARLHVAMAGGKPQA